MSLWINDGQTRFLRQLLLLSDEEEELRREALSLESADARMGEGMVNAALLQWLGFESTAQTPLSCWIIYTEMFRRVYHQFLPWLTVWIYLGQDVFRALSDRWCLGKRYPCQQSPRDKSQYVWQERWFHNSLNRTWNVTERDISTANDS